MEDYRPIVLEKLNKLGGETVELLRRLDQLKQVAKILLIEEATNELSPPDQLVEQALTNHCQKEQLSNEEALNRWLSEHFLTRNELINQIILPIKLNKLALDNFTPKAEARFLQRKESLDQYTYRLLRVSDSGIAHELYLQIEAGEEGFETLATKYSEGPEQRNGGKVGPAALINTHPQLREKLRCASPGVINEPVLIEKWWVVMRLEESIEASFDEAMRSRMASELLQEWINEETNEVVKTIISSKNEKGLT